MQRDLDQSEIRERLWKRSQDRSAAESVTWTQTPPNLKLSWEWKGICLRQDRITKKPHLFLHSNTDVQPDIFQNPVLIFFNEQFKAHENILFIFTVSFKVILTNKPTAEQFKKKKKKAFLCKFATTNNVQTWLCYQDIRQAKYVHMF